MNETIPVQEVMPELPGSAVITQSSRSNLALSFFSLPAAEKQAMSTFYAFCRVIDDVADSTELSLAEKRRQLGQWREEIRRAYLSEPRTPLGREMAQIIRTYLIAPTLLEDVLSGVEMDLEVVRFPDFAPAGKILLRGGQRRRIGEHRDFWVPRSPFPGLCHRSRHRASAHEHSARCEKGRVLRPAFT